MYKYINRIKNLPIKNRRIIILIGLFLISIITNLLIQNSDIKMSIIGSVVGFISYWLISVVSIQYYKKYYPSASFFKWWIKLYSFMILMTIIYSFLFDFKQL